MKNKMKRWKKENGRGRRECCVEKYIIYCNKL